MFASIANFVVYISVLIAAAPIARRNVMSNRADRRTTAQRLAAWTAFCVSVGWLVLNHHATDVSAGSQSALQRAGLRAVPRRDAVGDFTWSVEPHTRGGCGPTVSRLTRLFAGHIRDPRVRRDILVGCVFGIVSSLIEALRIVILPLTGNPMPRPILGGNLILPWKGRSGSRACFANWTLRSGCRRRSSRRSSSWGCASCCGATGRRSSRSSRCFSPSATGVRRFSPGSDSTRRSTR